MTTLLVLGGSGFVGREITQALLAAGHAVVVASRQPQLTPEAQLSSRALDVLHEPSLLQALAGIDVVVNATTGSGAVIAQGAQALARAMRHAGVRHLVHLSSQAVYGAQEGWLAEDTPLQASLGWYGQAKIEAESAVRQWAEQGGRAVLLRPGCVVGPGSPLWTTRVARWLQAGHLGDLGAQGDGWSNLVHVRDVAQAVVQAATWLQTTEPTTCVACNLAAPDAPRWNQYFADAAGRLNIAPLPRLSARRLWCISRLIGVPLKVAERLGLHGPFLGRALPPGMAPSVAALWGQQIRLDVRRSPPWGPLAWTPYAQMLDDFSPLP